MPSDLPIRGAETSQPDSIKQQVEPAIVRVVTRGRNPQTGGIGTGFVVHVDAGRTLALTAAHVVQNASTIEIETLGGRAGNSTFPAAVVGFNARLDWAILEIEREIRGPIFRVKNGGQKHADTPYLAGLANGRNFVASAADSWGDGRINGNRLVHWPVESGCSGGPVFDRDGIAFGIISGYVTNSNPRETIWARVPVNELQRVIERHALQHRKPPACTPEPLRVDPRPLRGWQRDLFSTVRRNRLGILVR